MTELVYLKWLSFTLGFRYWVLDSGSENTNQKFNQKQFSAILSYLEKENRK